jgi:hypothetical protein
MFDWINNIIFFIINIIFFCGNKIKTKNKKQNKNSKVVNKTITAAGGVRVKKEKKKRRWRVEREGGC